MEQLITIKNGNKQNSVFSSEEMEKRLSKLRSNMETENLDAILFTSIHNINYYNHFVYCSFGRPYGLVVTQDNLKSISANIDGGQPWRRTFGENLVYTDWQKDSYFCALQQLIENKDWQAIEALARQASEVK